MSLLESKLSNSRLEGIVLCGTTLITPLRIREMVSRGPTALSSGLPKKIPINAYMIVVDNIDETWRDIILVCMEKTTVQSNDM